MGCYAQSCVDCGSDDIVTDYGAGDVVCRNCGIVLGERIVDDTPEWRTFSNDDRGGDAASKSRVGQLEDQGIENATLTTILVDSTLDKINGNTQTTRLPKLNKESADIRRKQNMTNRIREISETLSLPKIIVEVAMQVYQEAERKGILIRGPEKESMAAAVVFIACRQAGHARTLKEIEGASGVMKKKIGKSFLILKKQLNFDFQQATTTNYVERFCSRLGLPAKTQVIAHDVAKKAQTLGLTDGKSPTALAASVIYLVAAYTNMKRSIQEISNVTMIAEKNVKTVCKELNKSRLVLFEGIALA